VRFKNRYMVVRATALTDSGCSRRQRSVISLDGGDDGENGGVAPDLFPFSSHGAMLRLIKRRINERYGDLGTGCTMHSLQVKFFDAASGFCVIRVARSQVQKILAILNEDGARGLAQENSARIEVVHVAGSPRQCNAKLAKLTPSHCAKCWSITY